MSEKLEEIKIDQKAKEWLGEDNMLGYDIWDKKYRHNEESFEEWLTRVSDGSDELKELIREKKFLFGGKILSNRGLNKDGKKITYSNCYVLAPPEDFEDNEWVQKYLDMFESGKTKLFNAITIPISRMWVK